LQVNDVEKKLISELELVFGNRLNNIKVVESTDKPYTMLGIEFELYNFFGMRINYISGRFACTIIKGSTGFRLYSDNEKLNDELMKSFMNEIKEQVELRIPDKYLIKNNWL
jgi:hypothetical protein